MGDHIHLCGRNSELNLCTRNDVEISFAYKQNKTYLKEKVVQILILRTKGGFQCQM
jgi:hypothetical protein